MVDGDREIPRGGRNFALFACFALPLQQLKPLLVDTITLTRQTIAAAL